MMKAAVLEGPNMDFTIIEKPIPEPGAGQIRIKVMSCGVCYGDAFVKFGLFPGLNYPRSPGHEVSGVIDAVGANVVNWKVGEHVGVGWHGGHCFTCDMCRRGDFVRCSTEKICGISYDGGYQQYMIAPVEVVVAVPEGFTHEQTAPLLCAGMTVYNAMKNTENARVGDIVAVLGIGGLGHMAIQFARKMGFYTIALSRGDDKKELSLQFGAHEYLDMSVEGSLESLKKKGGAKIIVATAPSGQAISNVVPALAINGTLLDLSVAADNIEVNTMDLITKRGMIKGWPSGTAPDSEDALKFSKHFEILPMIENYPLEQANEAFQRMITNQARFRVVLTMGH